LMFLLREVLIRTRYWLYLAIAVIQWIPMFRERKQSAS
jgi:hypothetical protein